MSMIERVAKSAYAGWRDMMKAKGKTVYQSWEDLNEEELKWAYQYARIAIEAMREPTEAMKHALNEHGDEIHYSYGCQVCGGVAEGYKAMIDAALKDA